MLTWKIDLPIDGIFKEKSANYSTFSEIFMSSKSTAEVLTDVLIMFFLGFYIQGAYLED